MLRSPKIAGIIPLQLDTVLLLGYSYSVLAGYSACSVRGLLPAPRGDYNFPFDIPLLAAGQFIIPIFKILAKVG
jgi:hypothetical protein